MRVYENRQCDFFSISDNLHAILSEKMRKNHGIAPENDLCTIPPSFLIGSSSFLQVKLVSHWDETTSRQLRD